MMISISAYLMSIENPKQSGIRNRLFCIMRCRKNFFDCVLRDPVVIELCNKSSAKLLNIDLHLLIHSCMERWY